MSDKKKYRLLFGAKQSNNRIKLYESEDDYLVVKKKYIFGFLVSKEEKRYYDYREAEKEVTMFENKI